MGIRVYLYCSLNSCFWVREVKEGAGKYGVNIICYFDYSCGPGQNGGWAWVDNELIGLGLG